MLRWCLLAVALVGIVGCQTGTINDPNVPTDRQVSPEVLRSNLKAISDSLIERRLKREIDNEEYRQLIAKAAAELVDELDLRYVDPAEAWQYGEVLRAARNWSAAKEVLEIAVKHAQTTKNEDRRVNDTLRLAHVMAQLGQVQGAIETAKSVLDATPEGSAPILLAVYLEIVPPSRGKGYDLQLAELIDAAIEKHIRTVVPDSQAGSDFLVARRHHVEKAYLAAADLYGVAGKPDLARRDLELADKVRADFRGYLDERLGRDAAAASRAPLKEGQSRL